MEEDLGEEVTYDVTEHIPAFVAHRVLAAKMAADINRFKTRPFPYTTRQKIYITIHLARINVAL